MNTSASWDWNGLVRDSVERLRVLIVAGMTTGVVVGGVGGRLAMLLLRLTSSDLVVGVTSDDGFVIGQVTLGGTYNLLTVGAAVGVIGAVAYRAVATWLIGPPWFRRLTTAVGAGLVVGSLLVHADGVDFTLLEPTWLAVGLFVAVPALFGAIIGPVVDRVTAPDSWTRRGARRWVLPIALLVCFLPATGPLLLIVVPATFVWTGFRQLSDGVRIAPSVRVAVQAVWVTIAGVGLVLLVNDIDALV